MPEIILLGGFLGSGKTSCLKQISRYYCENKQKVAIIENEIGEVSVDDHFLGVQDIPVQTLFAGCVCCTLTGELCGTIRNLVRQEQPDVILLETTGVAVPSSVKKAINEILGYHVTILCLVDCERWSLLSRAMDQLVEGQLENASVILLNKIDKVSAENIAEVESSVRKQNPSVKIYRISANRPLPDELLKFIQKGEH